MKNEIWKTKLYHPLTRIERTSPIPTGKWTTMKRSFHSGRKIRGGISLTLSAQKNHFHGSEKHIFMFVCSNEKLENHPRTINCDDSKMTPQIFHGFFAIPLRRLPPPSTAETAANEARKPEQTFFSDHGKIFATGK